MAADALTARLRRLAFGRWPTGAKLFLILSIGLLPLALIGMLATLQTTRLTNVENRARLRVASAEGAHALAIELIGDMTALRAAMNALDGDPGDAPSCARVQGVFAQQAPIGARFLVADARGRVLCGTRFPGALSPAAIRAEPPVAGKIVPGGLVLGVAATPAGHAHAVAFFPAAFLADIARPSGFTPEYGATLVEHALRLSLQRLDYDGGLDRRETLVTPLAIGDLSLEMQVHSAPITSSLVVALLLPLLMWAAAAAIGWFVVDRLLIRPLQRLRTSVATYAPGDLIDPVDLRSVPAAEIRELGDTFRAISRTVALHEAGLAEGLVRQTKLTREVHHRVKNNLQVISSLINIHARSSRGAEATDAYASIQRRVDALAVVHRNHFAEAEENRGLNLRSVIGELASNIRATAPEGSSQIGIVLDVDPFFVNQDVAVAVTFLVTEMVELAMTCDPGAQLRVSIKSADAGRALLRVSARALSDSDALRAAIGQRYGRVIEGLSRQLRAPMHHDPLVGAYEIAIAVVGQG